MNQHYSNSQPFYYIIKIIMSKTSLKQQNRNKNKPIESNKHPFISQPTSYPDDSSCLAREERLSAEILRIKSQQLLHKIETSWRMNEQQLIQFLSDYKSLSGLADGQEIVAMDNTKLVRSDRKVFIGQIHNKKKYGRGITIYKDGRLYEGSYLENEKSGKGCQVYSNGNIYIGEYHQNKKHGKGTFFWFSLCDSSGVKQQHPKIEQYEGMWWGGLPDGEGQHQKVNGDFYLGHFKNGLKHGEGVEYFSNGDKYSGRFVNGLPEGFGEYVWRDSSNYRGDFKQGYRNGYGVWMSPGEVQSYKGHYMLDRKHGYGVYNWGNGYVYKGNFMEDQRCGEGSLFFNEEELYNGFWLNGEKCQEEDYQQRSTQSKGLKTAASKFQLGETRADQRMKRSKKKAKNDESFLVNFQQVNQLDKHKNCYACFKRSPSKTKSMVFPRQGKSCSCSRGRSPQR